MKPEPFKEWKFKPTCDKCVENFHNTAAAIRWLEEQSFCYEKGKSCKDIPDTDHEGKCVLVALMKDIKKAFIGITRK